MPKGLPPYVGRHASTLCTAPPMPAAASAGMELCVAAPLVHATKNRPRRRSSPRTRDHRHNPSSSPLLQTAGTALAAEVTLRPAPASEPEPEPAGEPVEGEPELDRSAAQPTQSTTTSVFDVGTIVAYYDPKGPTKEIAKVIAKVMHVDHAADPQAFTIELPGGAQRQVGRHELHRLVFPNWQLQDATSVALDPNDCDRISDDSSDSRDRFGVARAGVEFLEGSTALCIPVVLGGLGKKRAKVFEVFFSEVTAQDLGKLLAGCNPDGWQWHHKGQLDLSHDSGEVVLMRTANHCGSGHGHELHTKKSASQVARTKFDASQKPRINIALGQFVQDEYLKRGSFADLEVMMTDARVAVPDKNVGYLGKLPGISDGTKDSKGLAGQLREAGYVYRADFLHDDGWKQLLPPKEAGTVAARLKEIDDMESLAYGLSALPA